MTTLKDWLGTFLVILISPTPKTFVEEAEKAENKFASAIAWSVFIAICSYLLPAIAGYVFDFTILIVGLIAFPLMIVLVPSTIHFMLQRVFHRKQYMYDKLLYIFVGILVPFQLIGNLTFFVPLNVAPVLNYIVLAYQFVLLVIALKAISKLDYWQSIGTILVSAIAGAFILICTLPVVTSFIGGVNRTMR